MPVFIENARLAYKFRIDPVTVLEEKDERRRTARLAAYMVVLDDQKRESDKNKAAMEAAKSKGGRG